MYSKTIYYKYFLEIDSGRKNRNDEGFSNLAYISHIQLKDDL